MIGYDFLLFFFYSVPAAKSCGIGSIAPLILNLDIRA